MANAQSGSVRQQIHQLFSAGTVSGMSDAQLLERFAERDEDSESALAALVMRHGSMVLGACRRVLGDPHAAEDTFQATFLLLQCLLDPMTAPYPA